MLRTLENSEDSKMLFLLLIIITNQIIPSDSISTAFELKESRVMFDIGVLVFSHWLLDSEGVIVGMWSVFRLGFPSSIRERGEISSVSLNSTIYHVYKTIILWMEFEGDGGSSSFFFFFFISSSLFFISSSLKCV